jgi:GTP pyrophosphokinase
MATQFFTPDEKQRALSMTRNLLLRVRDIIQPEDYRRIKSIVSKTASEGLLARDRFGKNPVLRALTTSVLLCDSISPDRNMVVAIMLQSICSVGAMSIDDVKKQWDEDVAKLVSGLLKAASLYSRHVSVESENFRKLLLTFAEDIRVIIIMIVDRLALMRAINHHPNEKLVNDVAYEANYLYAALAHRLGLYAIKSELEDLSLKYTNRETYTRIAHKLNETKIKRDAYISDFIRPIKEKLEKEGLKFEIKGRTKSIYSIWNKMRKQHNDIEDIYDLFAIRIVLDVAPEREKPDCWLVYSLITDMYQPNPSRMKDWISIPKSNGYESLHITVYGPENRWVEVQIRTKRMDLIAEKGLAAHWKYKGIKSENDLDAWMNNVRDILEAAESGPMELMKGFKMDIYQKEVFAFTPKGDLYKLPLGASLLDFAFNIHTKLGSQCTGGRVNGQNRKLNYKLQSGDTVEIFTSPTQVPKQDWLNFVVTSKARNKIRATLKEMESRTSEFGKELLQRRFKNRKIEFDEAIMSKTVKKMGYKNITDFFSAIADESLDINNVVDAYTAIERRAADESAKISASEYVMQPVAEESGSTASDDDVVIIGDNIKGINYKLAKCCNPIFGDDVFGFVSAEGVIKIHCTSCPNASHIKEKYPYRVIRTRWSGKLGTQFAATLRIIGQDDIGIVTNITSIINKEKNVSMRNISIDSNDGLFHGYVIIGINDTESLNQLIKKLKTIKGVKDVQRSN